MASPTERQGSVLMELQRKDDGQLIFTMTDEVTGFRAQSVISAAVPEKDRKNAVEKGVEHCWWRIKRDREKHKEAYENFFLKNLRKER